jgi:hypothetical protein
MISEMPVFAGRGYGSCPADGPGYRGSTGAPKILPRVTGTGFVLVSPCPGGRRHTAQARVIAAAQGQLAAIAEWAGRG